MKKVFLFISIFLLIPSIILVTNGKLIKYYIKENVSKDFYLRASQIKKLILNKELDIAKYQKFYASDKKEIYKSINNGSLNISVRNNDTIINGKKFIVNYFPKIFPSVLHGNTNTNYIDFFKNDLIVGFKNGVVFRCKLTENTISEIEQIPNNLFKFFRTDQKDSYFDAFVSSKFGVKDIMINGNEIYVSYIEEIVKDGFNTSILKAQISDSLIFEKFFSTNQFISKNYREFYPIQSGGRILNFKKDSILFTIGEYRFREKAQDINSINGKTISIHKKNKKFRVVSMGNRNSQGIDYCREHSKIIMTEHGPHGGDEINLIKNVNSISNFGWPISSYGIHYDLINVKTDNHAPDIKRRIKSAPLHKSHSEFGFIEPIKYFKENPGISEIRFINCDNNYLEFIVSTLGTVLTRPFVNSIIHMKYDLVKNKTEILDAYDVNGRVRDLMFKNKRIWYSDETNGIIGSFKL